MKVFIFVTAFLVFGAIQAHAATECVGRDSQDQEIIVSVGSVVNVDVIAEGVNLSNYVETIGKTIKGNVVTMTLMSDFELSLVVNIKTGLGRLIGWDDEPISLKCHPTR